MQAQEGAASSLPFQVRLRNFEGPFDLLLNLIGSHELDITEVALSAVTDEFLAYIRSHTADTLEHMSEFVVVAATLLDLKIVSLLPQGEAVDAEDIALLEARDLLFARLLQYRAFKEAAKWFAERCAVESARHPRIVTLEERFRKRAPELIWTLSASQCATLAAEALAPRVVPTVGLAHLHAPQVSIREQAALLVARIREGGEFTFGQLIRDAGERAVVVARFLAVLELYRHAAISISQPEPLGDVYISWVAVDFQDDSLAALGASYDR